MPCSQGITQEQNRRVMYSWISQTNHRILLAVFQQQRIRKENQKVEKLRSVHRATVSQNYYWGSCSPSLYFLFAPLPLLPILVLKLIGICPPKTCDREHLISICKSGTRHAFQSAWNVICPGGFFPDFCTRVCHLGIANPTLR